MLLFFVLLLIPILLQQLVVREGNVSYAVYQRRNKIAITFFFLCLTVLVALRHESVGNDTVNYVQHFEKVSNMSWYEVFETSVEFGFSLFNKIVLLASQKAQIFFAVAAVAVSAMIYPTYKRLCVDASLTIVLFCTMSTFFLMFSGIRQMLAVGLGVVAYELTRKKKLVFFILLVLFAMTFHTSAFMIAFMYPLYHVKITKNWLIVVVPVSVAVFIFNRPIFSFLSLIIERYTEYEGGVSSTGAYTMLILFAIFAVFSFLIPDENRMDEETVGLRNFLLFSLLLQMFAPLHLLAMRMNYYYAIFIPVLIPKIIGCSHETWSRVSIWARHIMLVFFLGYFFLNAYFGNSLHVFPYRFFWES